MFNKEKKNSIWESYSDLLMGLSVIFIIISISVWNEYRVKKAEYEKVEEIKSAFKNLSKKYFDYNEKYQKHILKIDVHFNNGEFEIKDKALINELNQVKDQLVSTMDSISNLKKDIRYLLIIEGQSSKDGYNRDSWRNNDVLSYQRALSLKKMWFGQENLEKVFENCEVIIAGSGEGGYPREKDEIKNQRFLIQIIPKIDKIKEN